MNCDWDFWIGKAKHQAPMRKTRYKVFAVGLNRKGEVLGMVSCSPTRFEKTMGRSGTGVHAEIRLIRKYGRALGSIMLIRPNKSGTRLLPIHPCENCAKVLQKCGIKVLEISS